MPDISIPQVRRIVVDTRGAQIVQEESPATRDSRGIYLPHYIEPVSHIAVDIGGSLAKVVYFTRSNVPIPTTPPDTTQSSPFLPPSESLTSNPPPLLHPNGNGLHSHTNGEASSSSDTQPTVSVDRPLVNGALTPKALTDNYLSFDTPIASSSRSRFQRQSKRSSTTHAHPIMRRSSLPPPLPGGLLNFARFETTNMEGLISFLQELIATSAAVNRVSVERMKQTVKVMATGGGAHMYYDRLKAELGVEVAREEEMECLILGLGFIAHVPEEVFWFSEELVYKVSHRGPDPLALSSRSPSAGNTLETLHEIPHTIPPSELPRPSPTPPAYQVTFAPTGAEASPFPCLVVNIGSGVSIVKVDEDGSFERVSGTSLGGGTLWGLLSLLTDARSFDEMLALSEAGDNSGVDMLVGEIYGSDANKIGLKASTIASSFGKVFKKSTTRQERSEMFKQADIARSLLYAISNNIGHVAYMNAAKYGLERVFFGGCFIRGHAATISTLSYAIRFWSKGTMRAHFLRHEGFLGAIGAWIKNVETGAEEAIELDG